GKWLVTLSAWLFAISTMISWSYYGEQGILYLFGGRAVFPYKAAFCLLAVVATLGHIRTDQQLNVLTTFGTGLMLWVNIPIMLLLARKPMRAYRDYIRCLKAGEMKPHSAQSIQEIVEGREE
ncbi:MAG: alanine:cation symporter family protein, partial [Planctomycetota bacterium]